jgi:hypothetical protein
MMKKSVFGLVAAAALGLLLPNAAIAQQLIVNGSGQLTGATGVNVNGTLYDVTFVDGTCDAVFGSCGAGSTFTFSSSADAIAAAQALLDQVFTDGAAGQFDSEPALTLGCGNPQECVTIIPYSPQFPSDVGVGYDLNSATESADVASFTSELTTFDFSQSNTYVWARFVPESGVPEPSSWALMLLGFGAVGAAMRRTRRTDRLPQLA